jgi:hypothetical protein
VQLVEFAELASNKRSLTLNLKEVAGVKFFALGEIGRRGHLSVAKRSF